MRATASGLGIDVGSRLAWVAEGGIRTTEWRVESLAAPLVTWPLAATNPAVKN
jgi:hypothetical protein